MNTPRPINVDQELSDWLEDGPSTAPDETLGRRPEHVPHAAPATRRAARVGRSRVRHRHRAAPGRRRRRGRGRCHRHHPAARAKWRRVVRRDRRLADTHGHAVATPVPSAAILVPTPLVASAAPSPAPTAPPTVAPVTACTGADLAAQLLDWQGAAGTRFGTVRVHDAGTTDCLVSGTPGLQLVDGQGSVFLDSANLGGPASVSPAKPVYTLHAGGADSVYLLVGLQNYCGADPVGTVHIDLVLPSSLGGTVGSEVSGVTVSMARATAPASPAVLHVQQGWSTTAP